MQERGIDTSDMKKDDLLKALMITSENIHNFLPLSLSVLVCSKKISNAYELQKHEDFRTAPTILEDVANELNQIF